MSKRLAVPAFEESVRWVHEHLGQLACDDVEASGRFVGGQTAADEAAATFDVSNYARRRNQVWPPSSRGASGLSPWIRHGLLPLPRMWAEVADGPSNDVRKFRDELLWQEYARHVYARLGSGLGEPLRGEPVGGDTAGEPWDTSMRCMEKVTDELHTDGWMVNQTRMWFASQWSVRHGADWRVGEDRMFTHLLDGSRAANRLGWQWTTGTGNGKRYGFSRWQVEKRAPTWCKQCDLSSNCPIQDWPAADQRAPRIEPDPRIARDEDPEGTAGPAAPTRSDGHAEPEAVWLTAESLGDDDPALVAHPDLPAVFCFDEPLLARLKLSSKRLVFLTQCLADLATRRKVQIYLGDPTEQLSDQSLATTFAPVPGWSRRADSLDVVVVHPWPWLHRPHGGSVQSFSAWRKQLNRR